jgi:hypothetical protein
MFGEEKEMIQNLDPQECMSLGRISQMSSSLRTIVQQRLNLPMPLDEDISHVLCLTCRTHRVSDETWSNLSGIPLHMRVVDASSAQA